MNRLLVGNSLTCIKKLRSTVTTTRPCRASFQRCPVAHVGRRPISYFVQHNVADALSRI
jgi:hypothetical protein